MPTARTCHVSFTNTNNIRHAVEVAGSTLYEAATLAMAEFRRCGFTENMPGSATRLTVTVKVPATSHEALRWAGSRLMRRWCHIRKRRKHQILECEVRAARGKGR